jgi:protein tyrosine kinase modulator
MQILTGLQNRLQSANDALNQAQQQKLYLQSLTTQYRALRPAAAPDQKGIAAPVSYGSTQRLQQLRSQLAELQAKYTPRHPDVVRLQQEIAEAEKAASLDAQSDEQKSSGTVQTAAVGEDVQAAGPMLQIQSQLKATEFEIANRKAEIKNIEGEIDSYQNKLNLAPAREQELAAITRDHEQSRAYYESLLAKRNQSEMATNLEKRQQGEQFRMIDPPSLPQRPYFPNRVLFSFAGIGFGLLLAGAYVVIRELATGRIYGEEELTKIVECRNMVLIPSVLMSAEIRRKNCAHVLDGAMAAMIALTIPAATLFLYYRA